MAKRVFPARCPKCELVKEKDEFPDCPSCPGGKYGYCKSCKSEYMRDRNQKMREDGRQAVENLLRSLRRYGVDMAWYLLQLAVQGERCAICGGGPTGNHKRLVIDHRHSTGLARGLLCGNCNKGLGSFGDSPEMLRKAAQYLEDRGHDGA